MKHLILISTFFLLANITIAEIVTGKILDVKDGDTYSVQIESKIINVRLEGIDCPEKNQPFGSEATAFVTNLILGKTLNLNIVNYDYYKRAISVVYLNDGRNLSEVLLSSGLAWHYPQYNNSMVYVKLERKAYCDRQGLWADENAIQPWVWRNG